MSDANPTGPGLEVSLPHELLLGIFSHLGLKDLSQVRQTSRIFNTLGGSQPLLLRLLSAAFEAGPKEQLPTSELLAMVDRFSPFFPATQTPLQPCVRVIQEIRKSLLFSHNQLTFSPTGIMCRSTGPEKGTNFQNTVLSSFPITMKLLETHAVKFSIKLHQGLRYAFAVGFATSTTMKGDAEHNNDFHGFYHGGASQNFCSGASRLTRYMDSSLGISERAGWEAGDVVSCQISLGSGNAVVMKIGSKHIDISNNQKVEGPWVIKGHKIFYPCLTHEAEDLEIFFPELIPRQK